MDEHLLCGENMTTSVKNSDAQNGDPSDRGKPL